MSEIERTEIEIPEISRVEGHSAVTVDVENGKVVDVKLEVFEGTRFFERIVLGHKYDEMPHITSRICAICSTGHVLAAIKAVENIFQFSPSETEKMFRELMHLGMIIESHATHICALALPDFVGAADLSDLAGKHENEFAIWTRLRDLGASIQTVVGGRPFHPVNLHAGGLSRYPTRKELRPLLVKLERGTEDAAHLITLLKSFNLPTETALAPCFLALIPEGDSYGYFGKTIKASDGWQAPVEEYTTYLSESSVEYSHSKRSLLGTKPFMVGSMARLFFFSEKLGKTAKDIFDKSPLAQKNKRVSSLWNNFAQAIEIVEAIERATVIIEILLTGKIAGTENTDFKNKLKAGRGVGAVECPRGTLYHSYTLDESGNITAADMITPSAQNSAHIELDIRKAAELELKKAPAHLRSTLETLVRAYDPCNTCATHMVSVRELK